VIQSRTRHHPLRPIGREPGKADGIERQPEAAAPGTVAPLGAATGGEQRAGRRRRHRPARQPQHGAVELRRIRCQRRRQLQRFGGDPAAGAEVEHRLVQAKGQPGLLHRDTVERFRRAELQPQPHVAQPPGRHRPQRRGPCHRGKLRRP
jgi:hypothetical protein